MNVLKETHGPGGRAESRRFGHLPDGRVVTEYTLRNRSGVRVMVLDYGGIIRELHVPDRDGIMGDVVLGFDEIGPYTESDAYFGAIVGRYAGRIADARFSINGHEVVLAANDGRNHLHGGPKGFHQVFWSVAAGAQPGQLVLSHVSQDGDEGYPGQLVVSVNYTLTDDNTLHVAYMAQSSAPTVINLTQHSYFNLAGYGNVLAHDLQVDGGSILELDESCIPTGILLPVAGTPFDFRETKPVGRDIGSGHAQLRLGRGYDHTWVLGGDGSAPTIVLSDRDSGRRLEIHTSEPGVQVYTANYLDGSAIGKRGRPCEKHAGIALETQHFPDSPNHDDFPSTLLVPGATFHSETVFRFGLSPD